MCTDGDAARARAHGPAWQESHDLAPLVAFDELANDLAASYLAAIERLETKLNGGGE